MNISQKVIITALLCKLSLYSQVNTESMRSDDPLPGIHHNMELDFAYIAGNTEILQLDGSYRMDYVFNVNWHVVGTKAK